MAWGADVAPWSITTGTGSVLRLRCLLAEVDEAAAEYGGPYTAVEVYGAARED